MQKWAREFLESEEYRDGVKLRVAQGKAPGIEALLWYYAYGKPAEKMELEAGKTLADLVMASRSAVRRSELETAPAVEATSELEGLV